MVKKGTLATALTLSLAFTLTACGGGTDNDGNSGGNNGGTGNTTLQTKLAACPALSMSSDPTAGDCLAGTYAGTTPNGSACSLTVRTSGGYDFSSPTLTYTYIPTARSFELYDHANLQGSHQVLWGIDDPIQTVTSYELDFQARFGPAFTGELAKIQIKATKINPDSSRVDSTCTVPL